MKIVVLDAYTVSHGDLSWKAIEELGELTLYDNTKPEKLIARAKDADCILTNKVVIDDKAMAALPNLKYIGVLATGTNVIDMEAAERRGITVKNIPAYSTDSVAQMTFAHLLNVMNQVSLYNKEIHEGKWTGCGYFTYWNSPLHELAGKKFGVIGMGNIGMKVARIALEFGMDVYAYTSRNAQDLPEGVRKITLDAMFSMCDIISLHCPLSPTTLHIINKDTLAKMHDGTIIINTGRGPLVDDAALAEALNNGHIAAYCADVMTTEPPSADNPLLKAKNVYLTPHIAWATQEARERLIAIAARNIKSNTSTQVHES